VMYRSAAQAKKKVAMASAKAVRSLYRLVKKPATLPSTRSAFQAACTRAANCAGWSSAAANKVLMWIMCLPSSYFQAVIHDENRPDACVDEAETVPAGRI